MFKSVSVCDMGVPRWPSGEPQHCAEQFVLSHCPVYSAASCGSTTLTQCTMHKVVLTQLFSSTLKETSSIDEQIQIRMHTLHSTSVVVPSSLYKETTSSSQQMVSGPAHSSGQVSTSSASFSPDRYSTNLCHHFHHPSRTTYHHQPPMAPFSFRLLVTLTTPTDVSF